MSLAHLRSSPRTDVPVRPSGLYKWGLYTLRVLVGVPLMCVWLPYLTATYFLKPKPFPSYKFIRHIAINSRLLAEACDDWPAPETDEKAWTKGTHPDYNIEVVAISPVHESLRKGIAVCPQIAPETRPGYWFSPKGLPAERRKGEKIILHMHVGSFKMGHPMGEGFMLVPLYPKENNIRMLSIGYRKALTAHTAFPAALLDVLGGYLYLTRDCDVPARDIMFSGESAGASLAIMLSQYLDLLGLPQPGRMGLCSPVFDLSFNMDHLDAFWKGNQSWDFYSAEQLVDGRNSAMRYYTDEAARSPWFSPCFAPPNHWKYLAESGTKVHIVYSTREVLHPQISMWIKAVEDAGVDIFVERIVDGSHIDLAVDKDAMAQWRISQQKWLKPWIEGTPG